MGQAQLQDFRHDRDAWDEDTLAIARHCKNRRDPLVDVISWLDKTEVDEAAVAETIASCTDSRCLDEIPRPNRREARLGQSSGNVAQPLAALANSSHPSSSSSAAVPAHEAVTAKLSSCLPGVLGASGEDARRLQRGIEDEEAAEWASRQRQTGVTGRLVHYEKQDMPRSDVMLRKCGVSGRILVTAATDKGKAAKAGVQAGDVLVSINGTKDFTSQPVDVVHSSLKPPLTLVFVGFVGKLQAEVRLNSTHALAGVSPMDAVPFGRSDTTVHIVDEIVFRPTAGLFLTSEQSALSQQAGENSKLQLGGSRIKETASASKVRGQPYPPAIPDALPHDFGGEMPSADATTAANVHDGSENALEPQPQNGEKKRVPTIYELKPPDARRLVRRAMASAPQGAVPPALLNSPESKIADEPVQASSDQEECSSNLQRHLAANGSMATDKDDQDSGEQPFKPSTIMNVRPQIMAGIRLIGASDHSPHMSPDASPIASPRSETGSRNQLEAYASAYGALLQPLTAAASPSNEQPSTGNGYAEDDCEKVEI